MAKKKTPAEAIDAIAKAQKSFLLTSIQADRQNLLLSIKGLEERIIALAQKRLEVDGADKLLGPKVNLKMAQKLHQDLIKEFDKRYGAAARSVVDGYEAVAKNIRKSWSDLNVAVKYTAVDQDMMETLKTSYYDEFKKFGLDAQNKMVRAMYDAVAGQSGFAVLADAISAALTGQRAKNGRPMSTYAKMFAHDATMNFHNAVTLKKADDAGIKNFLYYGNLMDTSRPFCIERAGKKFTKSKIESWTFPWAGKSGPAMTHRGGYNCRHHWMPVRPEWVGKEPRMDPMRIVGRMLGCIKKGG
jgi:hypothetical protein